MRGEASDSRTGMHPACRSEIHARTFLFRQTNRPPIPIGRSEVRLGGLSPMAADVRPLVRLGTGHGVPLCGLGRLDKVHSRLVDEHNTGTAGSNPRLEGLHFRQPKPARGDLTLAVAEKRCTMMRRRAAGPARYWLRL